MNDDDERTASEMFGDVPPGDPVKPREPSHLADYQPRRRWRRGTGARWYSDEPYERPETQDDTRTD
jgi:hypothetical protein